MIISSQIFEAHLKCPTKYYLKTSGEIGTGNAYADWLKTQNEFHQREGILHLTQGIPSNEYAISPPTTGNLKAAKWRLASDVEFNSEYLEGSNYCITKPSWIKPKKQNKTDMSPPLNTPIYFLNTRVHAVERVTFERRGISAQFIPIRFVFTDKVNKNGKLLLVFDSLVLSKSLGRKVSLGKLIYSDSYDTHNIKTSALAPEVQKIVTNIARLPLNSLPPDLVLNQHCAECEFLERCRQIALEKDDLSLLTGMTEKERKKYHGKGIFTINQLSYTFRPRRRPKRQGDRRENYHHSLKALAIREKRTHIVGNLDFKIEGTPVYLDVEGLPDRDLYYLIGVQITNDKSFTQYSLWADSPAQEQQIWTDFLGILATINDPVLIHYGNFEVHFFKQMGERYGGLGEESKIAKAINNSLNLLSVIYARIYFPTYSNRLKDIARFLDFEWSEPKASGIQTIIWRREWERSGSPYLKEKLIIYNQEDCEALRRVVDYLGSLSTSKFPPTDSNANGVVNTDSLPRINPFKFQDNQFGVPGLHEVNKAAYWDYQRERILLKSNHYLKRVAKVRKEKAQAIPKANKIIQCPPPSSCPYCSRFKVQKVALKAKTIFDIQFSRSGIKRWMTQYLFYRYYCPTCRSSFQNADRAWSREKFGPNIQAISIYLNISLGLTLEKIATFLNETLGFNIDRRVTHRFKTYAAEYYKHTYEGLLRNIVNGHLLHADETKIYLHEGTGYVWVFTNVEEVVYIYAPSREGGLVAELLKDFKGVLVSDFYTIYDSLNCPQQKCIIHLIRDMNNALMKEPFNEEIKSLVTEFALLIKPMIDTVHRFGLKKRFLRKHHAHIKRFFKVLSQENYKTETAVKWRTRLERNRIKLFTFLDYDGIPWNNNNAEHAVKSFALLRRNFSGFSTENGIREYLILMSICETCKIKGLNFLEFLRSGEKDIDTFAERKLKIKKKTSTRETLDER
jgi:predicted RecB family nuclease